MSTLQLTQTCYLNILMRFVLALITRNLPTSIETTQAFANDVLPQWVMLKNRQILKTVEEDIRVGVSRTKFLRKLLLKYPSK